jgi:hypothetical protein
LRRIASSFGPAAPWRSSKISRGVFINHFSTQRRRERKGAIFFSANLCVLRVSAFNSRFHFSIPFNNFRNARLA